MEKLYTIGYYKACDEVVRELVDVNINGEKMKLWFCKNEKGMFVIGCKYRRTGPSYSCGHFHRGTPLLDVYFRKNFHSKEEGNAFYKTAKEKMAV